MCTVLAYTGACKVVEQTDKEDLVRTFHLEGFNLALLVLLQQDSAHKTIKKCSNNNCAKDSHFCLHRDVHARTHAVTEVEESIDLSLPI